MRDSKLGQALNKRGSLETPARTGEPAAPPPPEK